MRAAYIKFWRELEQAYLTPKHELGDDYRTVVGGFALDETHYGKRWGVEGVCIALGKASRIEYPRHMLAVMKGQLRMFKPEINEHSDEYSDTWPGSWWLGQDGQGRHTTFGKFASLRRALVCGLIAQMIESGDLECRY